jgi:multidrug resistance efflux pump
VRAPFQGYILSAAKSIGERVQAGDILFLLQTKESHAVDNAGGADSAAKSDGVTVKAKSGGVLMELDHQAGDYVSDGDQIGLIANPRSVAILLNVPYREAGEVRIGSRCLVALPDGRTLPAKISRSIPSVDPSSQTQTYVIDCGPSDNLPENLNLTVRIPVRTAVRATVLPKSCVLSNETLDRFWIMKITDDHTAVQLEVTKGIENDSLVQILAPHLSESDRIIVEGGYGLPDTAAVNILR